MGDGGCAVLSSRHALAEFCNSEPCQREELAGNWGAELGLARDKEKISNVSGYDERSSKWSSVIVMEPEVTGTTGVGDEKEKESRKHNCRRDKGTDDSLAGVAPSEATFGQAAFQVVTSAKVGTLETAASETEITGKLTKEERGHVSNENVSEVLSHAQSRRDQVKAEIQERELKAISDCSEQHAKKPSTDDQVSRNEQRCEGVKARASKERFIEKISESTTQKSGCQRISHERSNFKTERKSNNEMVLQPEKAEKHKTTFPNSTTEHKRASQYHHTKREGVQHPRDHGHDYHGSKAKDRRKSVDHGAYTSRSYSRDHRDHIPHHDRHLSKRDSKGRRNDQSDHEAHYSTSSKNSNKGKENADGPASSLLTSDSHVKRDDHHHVDRNSHSTRGTHRSREKVQESRATSNHEETVKHLNESDKCSVRSSSPHKDGCDAQSMQLNNEDGHATDKDSLHEEFRNGANNDKMENEHQAEEVESKFHVLECENQSPAAQKEYDSWPDIDVPMDLSPAPAEDIAMSSVPSWADNKSPGQTKRYVAYAPDSSVTVDDGKGWVYLDSDGLMQGPMPLKALKKLMDDGKLNSDHMVKVDGTDCWFTLEHAGLPHITGLMNRKAINEQRFPAAIMQNSTVLDPSLDLPRDFQIEKRVEHLMQGLNLLPGREEDAIFEALRNTVTNGLLDEEQEFTDEGAVASSWSRCQLNLDIEPFDDSVSVNNGGDAVSLDSSQFQSTFQSSRKWISRGGDWRLMCETDKNGRPEKVVLNQGMPIIETRYRHVHDPRIRSSICEAPVCRTFELPHWAYQYWEEVKGVCVNTLIENYNAARTSISCTPRSQTSTPRDGVHAENSKAKFSKVTCLSEQSLDPVDLPGNVEQDAIYDANPSCVYYAETEHSLLKTGNDNRLILADETSGNVFSSTQEVPTKEDLELETGDWFYLDGNGQEIGPFSYAELQLKAEDGLLYVGTAIYRKSDEIWVPLTVDDEEYENSAKFPEEPVKKGFIQRDDILNFHEFYPQFIGYMCGKLHEHVMKSYKSRDFSAMLHEGLRNCFSEKLFGSRSGNGLLDFKVDQDRFYLRHREADVSPSAIDGLTGSRNDPTHTLTINQEAKGWSSMEYRLLVKIFRYLETDMRSLAVASTTCKSWKAAVIRYKKEMTQIDLSSLGSCCSDEMFRSLTEHARNVSQVILRGCTALSPSVVKAYLQGLQFIEYIDTRGCDQLKELTHVFPQIGFSRYQYGAFDSRQKSRPIKILGERKSPFMSKHYRSLDAFIHDDAKPRRQNLTNIYIDGMKDTSISYLSHRNSNTSGGTAKRLKSLNKLTKIGSDGFNRKLAFKEYTKDSFWIKEDPSPAFDKKLEKDMAFVLQNLKDAKVPEGKKMSFEGRRMLAYRKIEDKLNRGLYPANTQGLRAFKQDLFFVARMLIRGTDKEAGTVVFGNTCRLISQLEEEFRFKEVSYDMPRKRKYEEYSSGTSLSGRKRKIGNRLAKSRLEKRKKYDESSDEDQDGSYKIETSETEEDEDEYSSQEDHQTEKSDSEIDSDSEVEDVVQREEPLLEEETDTRIWGARMTKASMVPPVTRKYELIEEYAIVADEDEVKKRMEVSLPKDYDKIVQAQEDRGIEFSHLEMPELREYRPRKEVQAEVLEQEVYGIDPYTHNLLMDSMPANRVDFPDARRHQLIEEDILKALNKEVREFTGSGKAPTKYPLELVFNRALEDCNDFSKRTFISALAKNMRNRKESHMSDSYVAYRKGLGVVCNHPAGFEKDEFIVEFFGEVYPAWRWYEKQDAIRSFQTTENDAAPEFYNIFLERPKGDALGYDLVVIDAMHKANYASRICHSCRPNCEARVTAVNGKYQIGVYTLRPVEYGEELTFDYNSITESKEEHEKSVCLCGSHVCRGSYLNFAGPETFQEVMKAEHGVLHRYDLLLQACLFNNSTDDDWDVLRQAGLGFCLLDGLPQWLIKYAAGVMRFLNEERQSLPREILKTILHERQLESAGESEAFDAEIQADGVFNTRLQNLAITLDKVRYIFKKIYGDPKVAPPPLRMLDPSEVVGLIWKNDNSVVAAILHGIAKHCSQDEFANFLSKVHEHEPSEFGDAIANMQCSLLWLRDELCKAPITCFSRHDAAADLTHLYAHTKLFFTNQDYPTFESPSLIITPLDLGPKHAHKLGAAPFKEWAKTYSKDYVLGQLIFWYKPNEPDPGASLSKASRGCLILPDPTSCYAKSPDHRISYSSMDRLKTIRRMEHKPQSEWNWKGQCFWEFKDSRQLLGSPMMDAIHEGTSVNKEIMGWLKRKTRAFEEPSKHQ